MQHFSRLSNEEELPNDLFPWSIQVLQRRSVGLWEDLLPLLLQQRLPLLTHVTTSGANMFGLGPPKEREAKQSKATPTRLQE
jgi:hypothetical protein